MNNSTKINFTVHNKFAVSVLVILFVSMMLPLVNLSFAPSLSYFELVKDSNLQVIFFLLCAVSFVLGLPRIVTRTISIIFIIVILMPAYNALSPLIKMGSSMNNTGPLKGIFNNMAWLKDVQEVISIGLPLFIVSIVVFTFLQFMPHYQTNQKWIDILETPPGN